METNISTEIIPNSTNIAANYSKTTMTEVGLDKDDFLQLLITQLEHQNPLEPLDNQAFISQLAQFNSLEELRNLNKQMATLVELQITQESEDSINT